MNDPRFHAMAKHTPTSVNIRQARSGQWYASVRFNNADDAEFWNRIFKAVMEEAAQEVKNESHGS